MKTRKELREQLTLFPSLSETEKRELMNEAQRHPDLVGEITLAFQWDELLKAANPDVDSDELIAIYGATNLEEDPLFSEKFEDLEHRLIYDTPLQDRSSVIIVRQQMLDSSSDAESQYMELKARVTGARIGRVHEAYPIAFGDLVMRAAAMVAILVLAYGGLMGVDHLQRTPEQKLELAFNAKQANIEIDQLERGAETLEARRAVAVLRLGADRFASGRRSFLGLFPRYEGHAVREAGELFLLVTRDEKIPVGLRQEGDFFYGKALLALSDFEGAAEAFMRARRSTNPVVHLNSEYYLRELAALY